MQRWLVFILLVMTTSVFAYDSPSSYNNATYGSDYQAWQGSDQKLEEMLKDLEQLINKAEKAKAADPRFLRDLRDLAGRYGSIWNTRIIYDDFADGNFNRDPAWQVSSGSFWVETGQGLRSIVEAGGSQQNQQQSGKSDDEDIAKLLLQVLVEKQQGKTSDSTSQQDLSIARIKLPANITNAFSLRSTISIKKQGGRFTFQVYSDRGREYHAYEVHYLPGRTSPLSLRRVVGNGGNVLASYDKTLDLGDGRDHQLALNRDRAGNIEVSIDGKILIKAKDTSYLAAYDGVMFVNAGNDMTMRSIEIYGTE